MIARETRRFFLQISADHPEQVAAILIRYAGGTTRKTDDFPGVFFFDDYNDALLYVKSLDLVPKAAQPR